MTSGASGDSGVDVSANGGGTPHNPTNDQATLPGGNGDGCAVQSRLTRLTASGDRMTGSELVLVRGASSSRATPSARSASGPTVRT